jgi:hypothetical protein
MSVSETVHKLKAEALAAEVLQQNISEILGDDDAGWIDAVEGETNLLEVIGALINRLSEIDGLIDGISEQARKVAARKKRLTEQKEMIRVAIGAAMEQANLKRAETPLGTVSVSRVGPKVLIVDEAAIPAQFFKPGPVDKLKIGAMLNDGKDVPGATLSNGGHTITISRS